MSVELHGTGESSIAFVGYSTQLGAMYSIPEQKTGVAKPKPEDVKQMDHVYWGDADDMPKLLADLWKKNPDLARAIQLKASIMYSSGVTYRIEDENGELINKRIPEVERFIEMSWYYPQHAVNHIFQYFIAFAQMLMDGSRKKIVKLHPLVAPHCRFEHVNAQGFLYKLYLNGKWDEGATKRDKETLSYRVVDPKYYDPYTFKQLWDDKDFSVVLPCPVASDDPYYPTPEYWTLKLSKWYDLAQKIPVFKDTIMKNQISIKYLIEMPDWWMNETYPDWNDYEPTKKRELIKAEIKKFEEFAAGYEKSGKSITVITKSEKNGQKYAAWNLKPIDDKMKDGLYVEDSLEATVKIYTSVGVDPGIQGITPGKPGSSRSGSERREAYNLQQVIDQRFADLILRPYTYAAIFNGWTNDTQRVVFGFKKPHLQTLDKVTAGARETTSTVDEN